MWVRKKFPIECAAACGRKEVALFLASHGQFDKKTMPRAIRKAQEEGHHELAAELSALQAVDQQDENGKTLLYKMIEELYDEQGVQRIRAHIESGANVNLGCSRGSPLLEAFHQIGHHRCPKESKKYFAEVIDLLLKGGADANFADNRGSVIASAAYAGNAQALKVLLPYISKSDTPDGPWYKDILYCASRSNECLEILKLLRKEGVDFRQCPQQVLENMVMRLKSGEAYCHRTGLDCATYADKKITPDVFLSQRMFPRDLKCVRVLLDGGADPTQTDAEGRTVLHWLFGNKSLDGIPNGYALLIDSLIAKGLSINAKDGLGRTALHVAIEAGAFEAVRYLLANGATFTRQQMMAKPHYIMQLQIVTVAIFQTLGQQ